MLRRSTRCLSVPFPVLRAEDKFPRFDLCIIGGGPGGVAAALRAVEFGRSVCIVEADRIGGADAWGGCVSSKMLWEISRSMSKLAGSNFSTNLLSHVDTKELVNSIESRRIMATLQQACLAKEEEYRQILSAAGVALIRGQATFANEQEIDIHTQGTGEYRALNADRFLIATGARPRQHVLHPCDHTRVVHSDDIFNLPIPSSMVIIGAGPMGCEFASIFANLGRTDLRLIDKATRILPKEDEDVAMSVQNQLVARGVTIHHDCRLFDLEAVANGCQYSIRNICTGKVDTFHVERALVAIGRQSNVEALGLENTRMRVKNGQLEMDAYNRCRPYQHIYCIGDACGGQKSVNLAVAAGRAVVNNIYGTAVKQAVSAVVAGNLATNMFLEEEVAAIGMNEMQCREQGVSYIAAKFDYRHLTRSLIMGQSEGFVKLITTQNREKRVLGVRAVGPHAGSVVEMASLLIRNGESVYELLKHQAAYPSMVSGVVECAHHIVGRSSHQYGRIGGVSLTKWSPS